VTIAPSSIFQELTFSEACQPSSVSPLKREIQPSLAHPVRANMIARKIRHFKCFIIFKVFLVSY
jgi:hypothetical protein